ncbi:Beta-lactamase enzyme family protein [Dyadobacter koreensis]|uniref:beta-lactamase n=1 Tax=Dyadobacter koreensis TaxID=408657 RepID=A0A1H6V0X4_9BACT|nr:serine hydrolase [Dyadobacter koreensis]SEI97536.1 Beta-lactamase enzyme family protein [Dyadobacter koreensis]
MNLKYLLTIVTCLIGFDLYAQKTDSLFLENLFKSKPELFSGILNHPQKNQVQVLYTQIDRDKNNIPHFKTFSYNLDDHRYFFPASTVKLPTLIFALEKINELKIPELTGRSTMITGADFEKQTQADTDSSAQNGLPSIEHYIKKVLLVSDNDAYNRLYEFVGRAEINQRLKHYGLNTSRILNRYAVKDTEMTSRHTNPIKFFNKGKIIYSQPGKYDAADYPIKLDNLIMGKAYLDSSDKLVYKPFNMANRNAFSMTDQQEVMKRLIFPEVFPVKDRFKLNAEDYRLIYTFMSKYPTESDFPKYDPAEHWATSAKFLFYGSNKNSKPDPDIRIFNKYGDSYGFIIDNAYFVDFENKVEFLLTAVVQSNEDEIYNDGKYEYEEVCYPFMRNLGQVIYQLELARKKRYLPDLTKFRMDYTGSNN